MVTVASLFDGIGGTPLSAQMAGAVCLWASEVEQFPIRVTQYHFPEMAHMGDVTKINGAHVPAVDIIVGGSPCQDLSVAGKRKGLEHEDLGDEEHTRSGLFMEQVRIVKEMRHATNNAQPRYVIWENVPGAFSSNAREDFRIVLEEFCKIADETVSIPRPQKKWLNAGCIMADGFSIAWRTVDAQYWGVAQRRRRIYLVVDLGGQSAPKILFEREGSRGDLNESGTHRQGTTGNVEGCAVETIYVLNDQGGDIMTVSENITGTLRAQEHGHQPVICLQGNGIDRADTAGCNGKGWTEDICYTLNTIDRPAVATYQNIVGTLCAADSKGVGNQYVADDKCIVKKTANTVRRLTPIECERLQGYPGGWTGIPGASDSARYRALGNSFAIPNAYFVISRCIKELEVDEP